jgi:hypothetical protein
MEATRFRLDITTSGLGGFTGYIKPNVSGFIHQVVLLAGLDASYNLSLTLEDTAVKILTQLSGSSPFTWLPRHPCHDNDDGTELLASTTGTGADETYTDIVGVPVAVGGERIKVVVTSGGNTKSCVLYVWLLAGNRDYLTSQGGGWCDASYTV